MGPIGLIGPIRPRAAGSHRGLTPMSRLQQGLSRLNSYSRHGTNSVGGNMSMASAAGAAAANKSCEDLKRHIHGKLVEKLDFTSVKDRQSDARRTTIRRV